MKPPPNNSTSYAEFHVTTRLTRRWDATNVIFGLVRLYTNVQSTLTPFFILSIFWHPPSSILMAKLTQQQPNASRIFSKLQNSQYPVTIRAFAPLGRYERYSRFGEDLHTCSNVFNTILHIIDVLIPPEPDFGGKIHLVAAKLSKYQATESLNLDFYEVFF